MVADTGDSANVTFDGCSFIGSTSWAAWPDKPNMRFSKCTFVGAIVRCFGSPDPALATQFVDCTFRDDPRLSPTGTAFLGKRNGPIADLSKSQNVRFVRCAFLLEHEARLPWSTRAIYADCVMMQRSANQSHPRGTFLGNTRITGNASLHGAVVVGQVTVNGKRVATSVKR